MSEELELARARAKAKLKLQQQQGQEQPEEVVQAQAPQEEVAPQPITEEGFKEQISGVGNIDKEINMAGAGIMKGTPSHIAAGIEAGFQEFGDGDESFGENYHNNLAELQDAIATEESKNPGAVLAADMVSGAIMNPAKSIAGLMATGGVSTAARLDEADLDVYSAAKSFASGAVVTGVFSKGLKEGIKAVSKVGEKLGVLGAYTTAEALSPNGGAPLARLKRHAIKTSFKPDATEAEAIVDMSERLIGARVNGSSGPYVMGKPGLKKLLPFQGQDFSETARLAKKALEHRGDRLSKVVDKMDDLYKSPIEGEDLYNSLRKKLKIDRLLSSGKQSARQLGRDLQKSLDTDFKDIKYEWKVLKKPEVMNVGGKAETVMKEVLEEVPVETTFKKFTPRTLQQLKLDTSYVSSKVGSGFSKLSDADKARQLDIGELYDTEFISAINRSMDAVSKSVSKANPKLNSLYKITNRDYSDMLMVNKTASKAAESVKQGAVSQLKRAFAVRGLLVAELQSNFGMSGGMGYAVGMTLNGMLNNPNASQKLAEPMSKIGGYLVQNPDSSFAKRILTAAQISLSAPMLNDMPLQDALASSSAEITLLQSPIQRNYADIENKSDKILESLQYHDPEGAKRFRTLLKANDKEGISAMANEISKMPEMQDYFEKGTGIDGRVYSPEEKAEMKARLDTMDISLNQKLRLEDDLIKNGTIPQVQEEKERFFKHEARDKSKPQY